MSLLVTSWAIARKDLLIERRSRTALSTALLFAVLVQLIMVFARDEGATRLDDMAPGVLWVMIALSSLLTLNRAFLLEREQRAMDGILLAPISRLAIFWGKWLANLVFVGVVILVSFPLWVLFFNVAITPALVGVLLIASLTAIGITAIGTVFSAMVVRTRFAELLLPILMLPFMIPPIFMASQATVRCLSGRPMQEIWGWLRMLALFDLAFLLLATMLFPVVVEE